MRARASLLVALLLVSFAASCGRSSAGDADGAETITIWETYNAEEHAVFDALARDFETEYAAKRGRRVRLDVERVPYEGLLPKLKYAAITHTAPDVCRVDNAWVLTLAYGKALAELDTLTNFGGSLDAETAKYVPAAISTNLVDVPNGRGGWDRHLFGLPDQTNCETLF